MPEPIDVHIAMEDIIGSHRFSITECPLARAIRRTVPHLKFVTVGRNDVFIWADPDIHHVFACSPETTSRITEFDHGAPMRPFTAHLIPYMPITDFARVLR